MSTRLCAELQRSHVSDVIVAEVILYECTK